jgi:hypothetical protein
MYVCMYIHTPYDSYGAYCRLSVYNRARPCRPLRDLINALFINRWGICMYICMCNADISINIPIVCGVAQGETKRKAQIGGAASGVRRPTSPKAETCRRCGYM